jgi:hypothetical protein
MLLELLIENQQGGGTVSRSVRSIIAICIFFFILISWSILVMIIPLPGLRDFSFKGASILAIILGLHLIVFRHEMADYWRRENRIFWGKSIVGDVLEPQYTPAITAVIGIFITVFGVVLMAVTFGS